MTRTARLDQICRVAIEDWVLGYCCRLALGNLTRGRSLLDYLSGYSAMAAKGCIQQTAHDSHRIIRRRRKEVSLYDHQRREPGQTSNPGESFERSGGSPNPPR
jgi:hypothetical protein